MQRIKFRFQLGHTGLDTMFVVPAIIDVPQHLTIGQAALSALRTLARGNHSQMAQTVSHTMLQRFSTCTWTTPQGQEVNPDSTPASNNQQYAVSVVIQPTQSPTTTESEDEADDIRNEATAQ